MIASKFQAQGTYYENTGYVGLKVTNSESNCKLSIVDNIGNLCDPKHLPFIKDIFNKCRQIIYLTVVNIDQYNFIKSNFELYSTVKIPIGYNNGFQYHIVIKNRPTLRSVSEVEVLIPAPLPIVKKKLFRRKTVKKIDQ